METEFVDQTEEKEQSDRVPEEAKTETEEEEISVSGFAVRIAGWFTGHLADILKLCAVLCLLMLVLGSGIKIRAAHRAHYGVGEDPAEAVRAIYRSYSVQKGHVEGLHGGRWRNDSLYQGFLSCIYGGRWQQTSETDPEGKLWK